ncbi:hypothetical protein M514_13254 [Trichuris suis]|uniref:Cystatin domain-containing protein n=1 Tax=Trichuris suis TaxID=68888 RepID=A0A085MRC7_9BILA|nr:hypothetical protein M513_13254 [Trichuris suis]KFD59773.1 hypothetical protein M514_13254 [Trichuris suis]
MLSTADEGHTLKTLIGIMVAGRILVLAVFCLASVSCIEKAMVDKFAQAAVNGINKDVENGEKLYKVQKTSNVLHNQDRVLFKLYAIETVCTKAVNSANNGTNCEAESNAPVLEYKVTAKQYKSGVFSVVSEPIPPKSAARSTAKK